MTGEAAHPEGLEERLSAQARDLGFRLFGIADPRPTEHMPFYEAWLARDHHGGMAYLGREDAIRRRGDLRGTMDTVRSVVVVGDGYGGSEDAGLEGDPGPEGDASVGIIARYARGADYHHVLQRRLLKLLAWLDEEVEGGARGRVYVDTGPILERDLGRRAGLGWFGRNTMLIDPRGGSYFFLGVLLLDVPLVPSEPFEDDRCGTCRACLDACPTGALLGRDEDGAPVMDARRCISYLTIEHRGAIPRELRPAMGNRIYGCDICQEVCPFTRRFGSSVPSHPAYSARDPGELPLGVVREPSDVRHPGTDFPSLIELMSMDEATWRSFSRGSPLKRPRREGFLRNVAVALGNWGSPEAVPVLSAALSDASSMVRGHSAWALGRIASPRAVDALAAALADESDRWVREELDAALGQASDSVS